MGAAEYQSQLSLGVQLSFGVLRKVRTGLGTGSEGQNKLTDLGMFFLNFFFISWDEAARRRKRKRKRRRRRREEERGKRGEKDRQAGSGGTELYTQQKGKSRIDFLFNLFISSASHRWASANNIICTANRVLTKVSKFT